MQWNEFFKDLEDQLAADQEAERYVLASEEKRVADSKRDLVSRLRGAAFQAADIKVSFLSGDSVAGSVAAVGADWLALRGAGLVHFVPIASVQTVLALPLAWSDVESLTHRMTFGYVLRDLARRRVGVAMTLNHGVTVTGTIDRAGIDHADLALHDPGEQRRTAAVRASMVVSFAAITAVAVAEHSSDAFLR